MNSKHGKAVFHSSVSAARPGAAIIQSPVQTSGFLVSFDRQWPLQASMTDVYLWATTAATLAIDWSSWCIDNSQPDTKQIWLFLPLLLN
jgi:hypothetical protein